MYILKNAFRCIGRTKGRNILIGIIALVIAVSACLGLSIRQAAESAKESESAPDGEFVRMMTIHKSKGLEFAWCIVPEMERRFRADTDSVVFDTEYGAAARVRNGSG